MTKDEALRLALEALEKWNEGVPVMLPKQKEGETFIVSYEPKLEAKDEPDYKALWQQMCERCDELDKKLAQRKPLTDEEILTYRYMIDWTADWSYIKFARAIEAAHGIKGEA